MSCKITLFLSRALELYIFNSTYSIAKHSVMSAHHSNDTKRSIWTINEVIVCDLWIVEPEVQDHLNAKPWQTQELNDDRPIMSFIYWDTLQSTLNETHTICTVMRHAAVRAMRSTYKYFCPYWECYSLETTASSIFKLPVTIHAGMFDIVEHDVLCSFTEEYFHIKYICIWNT